MVQQDPNSQQGSKQQSQPGKIATGGPGIGQKGQPDSQKGQMGHDSSKRDQSKDNERGDDHMPDQESDRPGLKTGEQERNEGPATPQAGMGKHGSEAMGNQGQQSKPGTQGGEAHQGKGQKGASHETASSSSKTQQDDKNTGNKGFGRSK